MTDAEFRKFYSLHLNRISALRKTRVSLDAALAKSRGAARTERLADAVNCDADMGNETLEILAVAVPLRKKKAAKRRLFAQKAKKGNSTQGTAGQ